MRLRGYQETAIAKLRTCLRDGFKRPIMALPTGGGKSHIFGQIISNLIDNGKMVLWLVHRRNLVFQMRDVLELHFNIEAGIIMAGIKSDHGKQVQLCTIQTYARRIDAGFFAADRFRVDADVVLIDEGHRSISKSYQDIIQNYSDKIIMACSATPMRADGRGMGEVYDSIVDVAGVKELTDAGHLAPARYFAPVNVDLEGVKTAMGDYQVKDLAGKVHTTKLIGDIVENWLKLAENRQTIVYAVNVKHSIAICEEFVKQGVNAEHLDARSNDEERDDVFRRMENGDITVICNVALYQEGLDVPDVSCIVMARPTKSMGLYRQCLDYETEILTNRGFLSVNKITGRDLVAGFWKENGTITWEKIISIVDRPLDNGEDMYSIETPHVNQRVTGGHRILFTGRRSNEGWKFKRADSLSKYKDGYRVPSSGLQDFNGVRLTDDEIRFIGLYMTDGSMSGSTNAVSICQSEKNTKECDYIVKCLKGCGFKYGVYRRTGKTNYGGNGDRLNFNVSYGAPRGKFKELRGWSSLYDFMDKEIAPSLDDMTVKQFKVLLESINVGDGNKYKNKNIYWNPQTITITSGREGFANRLQSMAVRRLYRCNITKDVKNNCFRIRIKKQGFSSVGGKNQKDRGSQIKKSRRYGEERVWCVENKSNSIIIRRNGIVSVIGNCCGRGLRPAPGKRDCLILDHGNVIETHGLLDWEIEWSLDGKKKAWNKPKREKTEKLVKCRACHKVFMGSNTCPDCGTQVRSFGKKILTVEAELEEIEGKQKFSMAEKRQWYGMFVWYCREKGYKDGWIYHKYKEKFSVAPHDMGSVAPIEPTFEFKNWMKYQMIKWAKGNKKRDKKAKEQLQRGGELAESHRLQSSQT